MRVNELEAALEVLGWSAAGLAKRLGCARSLPVAWLNARATVPPAVATWLRVLVRFHTAHPPPAAWRTRPHQPGS